VSSSLSLDSSSARGVVQQSKFSESVSGNEGLQESIFSLAVKHFEAIEFSFLEDEENGSSISLLDDLITNVELSFVHGANDNIELLVIEGLEHEGLSETGFDLLLDVSRFLNDSRSESLFSIEATKGFSTDRLASLGLRCTSKCNGWLRREFSNFLTLRVGAIAFTVTALSLLLLRLFLVLKFVLEGSVLGAELAQLTLLFKGESLLSLALLVLQILEHVWDRVFGLLVDQELN